MGTKGVRLASHLRINKTYKKLRLYKLRLNGLLRAAQQDGLAQQGHDSTVDLC